MTAQAVARPRVLADLLPGNLVRDLALIAGAAALTGIAAQIAVPLPFTPVPLSLQTLTVLLAGAALGPMRGGAAMGLYLVAGMLGVPWFSEQRSGWEFASFGYIVGFVLAAVGRRGVRAPRGRPNLCGDRGPDGRWEPADLRPGRQLAGRLAWRGPAGRDRHGRDAVPPG